MHWPPQAPRNGETTCVTAGAGQECHAAPAFRQVSVAAADIVTADVLATAIRSAGGMADTQSRATDGWNIEVLAVRAGGELLATPGLPGGKFRR